MDVATEICVRLLTTREAPVREIQKSCWFYNTQKGCKFGDDCFFLHERDQTRVCPYQDKCRYGKRCWYRHVVFWAVKRNDEMVTKERVQRIRRLRIKDGKEPKKSKLNVDSVESVSKAIISWKSDAEPDFFWRLDSIKEALTEDIERSLKEERHSDPTNEATRRVEEIIGKTFQDRLKALRLLGLCFLDVYWSQEKDWKMLIENENELVVSVG